MSAERALHFVGVDVGGTFTDVALASVDGRLVTGKVPTTTDDPRRAVADGIVDVLARAGVAPGDVSRVVHGTTLATNVILERRGRPTAYLTTAGFGDLMRMGREARVEEDRFDLFFQPIKPPLDHHRTFEVDERVDAAGNLLVPLDAAHARELAARVAATEPAAVAVGFLHAYANSANEEVMADACRQVLGPDVFLVTSSSVWGEAREYERGMTALMCAYVGPVMARYLEGLATRLAELGVTAPIQVMDSSGGVMSAPLAARRPVATIESGGAAGVIAAGFFGGLAGVDEVISFDMGGTTAKTGIVRGGKPTVRHDFQVGGKGSFGGARPGTGFPVKTPVVDMAEIGAGGGSIAWVDEGGALRVGPRSAGSQPGPACYGRGGMEPTVTDANLVLGYLNRSHLAGGVTLSFEAAEVALESVAARLGVTVPDAARAVHEIVNTNMAAAIRVVTIQRGIDPRTFALVGFGGAGPMHIARLAKAFGIGTVLVPNAAGVASAVGLVSADLSVDRARTHVVSDEHLDGATLGAVFGGLEQEARDDLRAAPEGEDRVTRAVDVRYVGQSHALTVPVPGGELTDEEVRTALKAFLDQFRDLYGVELDSPVEVVNFRVRVERVVDTYVPADAPPLQGGADALLGSRDAFFVEQGGFVPTPIYSWERLGADWEADGPVIVERADTTLVVPPSFRVVANGRGDMLLSVEGPA